MSEAFPIDHEEEPKKKDAAQLAELFYYSLDRLHKTGDTEVGEIVESIRGYIDFRTQQDPEMAQAVVNALESFRDPDPKLADLESAQDMQKQANSAREVLGLPARGLPTEIPPHDDR
jgi:hypothetical protein